MAQHRPSKELRVSLERAIEAQTSERCEAAADFEPLIEKAKSDLTAAKEELAGIGSSLDALSTRVVRELKNAESEETAVLARRTWLQRVIERLERAIPRLEREYTEAQGRARRFNGPIEKLQDELEAAIERERRAAVETARG